MEIEQYLEETSEDELYDQPPFMMYLLGTKNIGSNDGQAMFPALFGFMVNPKDKGTGIMHQVDRIVEEQNLVEHNVFLFDADDLPRLIALLQKVAEDMEVPKDAIIN